MRENPQQQFFGQFPINQSLVILNEDLVADLPRAVVGRVGVRRRGRGTVVAVMVRAVMPVAALMNPEAAFVRGRRRAAFVRSAAFVAVVGQVQVGHGRRLGRAAFV